ncbi:MAG: trypsin-like serine protease [Proteobacteria bacterium]|nr:trypsin-like serine protease [Pseudomonadota bacterium]
MQRETMIQVRLALTAGALGALALVGGASAAELVLSVSDTGVSQVVAPSSTRGFSGFQGQTDPGARADSQAEIPAFTMSDAEYARFLSDYKPAVPYYARDRAVPETVLGADRRLRYSPKESGYPYRAVGQVTFTQNGSNYICSGWLIGSNTVMTAGHCVHSGGSGGAWSTNVKFYPGRNGSKSPFGGCSARTLYSQTGWTVSGSEGDDYGAIKLNCTIGNTTGSLGWWWTTASQAGLPMLLLGYPGDKQSGTAWAAAARVEFSEAKKTRYKADTAGGMSGGVVVQADGSGVCQGDCGIAVHAYGQDTLGTNSGTRITQTVSNLMTYWRDTP